jgi:hypothetical protein
MDEMRLEYLVEQSIRTLESARALSECSNDMSNRLQKVEMNISAIHGEILGLEMSIMSINSILENLGQQLFRIERRLNKTLD